MSVLRQYGAGLKLVGRTLLVELFGKRLRTDAPAPSTGQSLVFDGAQDLWVPGSAGGIGSWLDLLKQQRASGHAAVIAGDFSMGVGFRPLRAGMSVKGVRFFWNSGTARTLRARLYQSGSVATATLAVSAIGTYEILFSSPVAVSTHLDYVASIYETSGAVYQYSDLLAPLPADPLLLRDILLRSATLYAAGDAQPATIDAGRGAYVEPLLV